MEYVVIGAILMVWWSIVKQTQHLLNQTKSITQDIESLKEALETKETGYSAREPIYNIDDIHKSIEELPKAMLSEMGYGRKSYDDLHQDLKAIKENLAEVNSTLFKIELNTDD